MKRFLSTLAVLVLTTVFALGVNAGAAQAHERRDVGKYQLTVGFIGEPALEGQKNGVDFRVTDNTTGLPVEGVEKTVQVEITHVGSGVSKVFNLRTIFRDPGHYTTDLILTASGHYRMRFFGTIGNVNVNETFNSRSGGGGFNDVEATGEMQFPQKVAEVREIEAVARHIEEENHDLEEQASKATTIGIAGVALGGLGTIVGAVALIASRRKRG